MRKDCTKRKKQRLKSVVVVLMLFLVITVTAGVFFLILNIQQQRAERKEHLTNAVMHINKGTYGVAAAAETVIAFNKLIKQAEALAGESDFDIAISVYETAMKVAATIFYKEGVTLSQAGIDEMHKRIIEAKRNEAMNLFYTGDQLYRNNQYAEALEYFSKALEIYLELGDQQSIVLIKARIDYSELKLAEMEESNQEQPSTDNDAQDDAEESELTPNYEHNLSISFDLRTLIDNQNQSPANRVRMGMRDGLNEGWYNGCGWVATYNALIIMENPKHPAEIVKHFEESGGIAFGGVFGTYPNAIEEYLKNLGYRVSHTLFPQLSMDIDETIKNSQVSILAYLHTGAAHYVTIVYKEDIDKFIVYNDSFACTRSASLGYQSYTETGAAIDSIAALISNTRDILFSFSLITVNN